IPSFHTNIIIKTRKVAYTYSVAISRIIFVRFVCNYKTRANTNVEKLDYTNEYESFCNYNREGKHHAEISKTSTQIKTVNNFCCHCNLQYGKVYRNRRRFLFVTN